MKMSFLQLIPLINSCPAALRTDNRATINSDSPNSSKTSKFRLSTTSQRPCSPQTMWWMPSSVGTSPSSEATLSTRTDTPTPGFSFSGEVREPFPAVINAMAEAKVPVTSVDAPSSWDIEQGPPKSGVGSNFHPDVLVSLTAPKPLVKFFKGRHFIGGR